MSQMDLLILPYEKKVTASGDVGDIGNFTSPMKLFDYLASSKPIIASSLPVLNEVLENKKNCIFVNSLNIFKWKLIIERILLNDSQKIIISRNNFFLAKKILFSTNCLNSSSIFLLLFFVIPSVTNSREFFPVLSFKVLLIVYWTPAL